MKTVNMVLGGIGALIAFLLVVRYADQISQVISAVATNGVNAIVVLQGRDLKGVTY